MHRSEKPGSGVSGNALLPCFEDDGTNPTGGFALCRYACMNKPLSIVKHQLVELGVLIADAQHRTGVQVEVPPKLINHLRIQ
jgi:hypothetical protein